MKSFSQVRQLLFSPGRLSIHVEVSDELNKGATDEQLAEISRLDDWIIVTYDDDFRDGFTEHDYRGVLYFADQTLSAKTVADVLHEISTYYEQDDLRGFLTVGQSWL
ncbi:DUF5615 family PIN-like protein [Halorubrum sp. GN11GM_10-3_MGM]|uniref:DUF5615 family PIN-like protein n=1 Tax=Halorubrum sp. GN11GM_10-3_MGM TaxID=2518111 RepID=UPI0026D3CCF9